ncbi:MAG: hypothetical protein M1828_003577 [Chrysothrix sp. TS-e1954]|nr:MAG: hypothetical protein M1828_003577 [Chrysothrix sp. TS-e1954]
MSNSQGTKARKAANMIKGKGDSRGRPTTRSPTDYTARPVNNNLPTDLDKEERLEEVRYFLRTLQYDKALQILQVIPIDHATMDLKTLEARTLLYRKISRLDDAESDARYMVENWPYEPRAYRSLAKAYLAKGDDRRAQQSYHSGVLQCAYSTSYQYSALELEGRKLLKSMKPKRKADPVMSLPLELIVMIFEYNSFETTCRCLRVSKTWMRGLAALPALWTIVDLWRSTNIVHLHVMRLMRSCARNNVKALSLDIEKIPTNSSCEEVVAQFPTLESLEMCSFDDYAQPLDIEDQMSLATQIQEGVTQATKLRKCILWSGIDLEVGNVIAILITCDRLEELEISAMWYDEHYCDQAQRYLNTISGPIASSLRSLSFTLDETASERTFNLDFICAQAPQLEVLRVKDMSEEDEEDVPDHDQPGTVLFADLAKFPKLKILALRCVMLKPYELPSTLEELELIGDRTLFNTHHDQRRGRGRNFPRFADDARGLPLLQSLTIKTETTGHVAIDRALALLEVRSGQTGTNLRCLDIATINGFSRNVDNFTQLMQHSRLQCLEVLGLRGHVNLDVRRMPPSLPLERGCRAALNTNSFSVAKTVQRLDLHMDIISADLLNKIIRRCPRLTELILNGDLWPYGRKLVKEITARPGLRIRFAEGGKAKSVVARANMDEDRVRLAGLVYHEIQ